jgi:hypothetical protein
MLAMVLVDLGRCNNGVAMKGGEPNIWTFGFDEKLVGDSSFYSGFSPYYSWWMRTQDQHVFRFDPKRILLKRRKKGGFFSMAVHGARTLSWRCGDDGVWLG